MKNTSTKLADIILLIVTLVLVITAGVLLFFGKIDFNGAMLLFGLVAALWGVNGAYRAPSPQQQQQLQAMMAQILETMPALINRMHHDAAIPSAEAPPPSTAMIHVPSAERKQWIVPPPQS